MKKLSGIKSFMVKAAALAVVFPLAVSCYDDSKLWDEIGSIEEDMENVINKLYELEDRLNSELGALNEMVKGQLFISSVSTDASTGVVTLTLSNGKKLQILPETDLTSTVTYLTIGGIDYWAYLDENGNKQLFKNEKGEGIPVASVVPEVVVRDGEYYIVLAGMEYPLGGNSIFSGYELVKDELTGEIYAVTFVFGEDMTFTVTVDGACGFYFVVPSGFSTTIISDYYVSCGLTERIQIEARGVVDYVLQIPDGWRVSEYKDEYVGEYLQVTAPSKELIESGVAVDSGDLKVVAVLEGGKATISRLYLTTSPFKEFGVSFGNVTAKMYNGLQKYVYGVTLESEYDESAIFETASGLLEAYDYPAGYGVTSGNLDETVAEILGSELVAGEEYVFWALPALYYQAEDEAGYYLKEDTFVSTRFTNYAVEFEVSDEKFRDATLTMELSGVDAYYMQVLPADDFLLQDVVYNLNRSFFESVTEPMSYTGSIFELAEVTAESDTDYVAWIAVAEDGKEYTEADVMVREFSTLKLEAGGSISVVAGDPTPTSFDVTIPLTAEGAETIYYTFMSVAEAKKYADDAAKALYLLENGNSVDAATCQAKLSESVTNTKPSTTYVMFATASDSEGKYGDVVTMECTTTELEYNDIVVDLKLLSNDPGNVVIGIEADNSEGFLYWIGKTTDNTWKSPNYLGGTVESAESYMYLNSDHNRFKTVMSSYPVVDGEISLTDLPFNTEYVIVAMAKSADGSYSHAKELKFVTRAVAIGTIVTSDDSKWEAARPTIEFIEETFVPATGMMSGSYSVNITIPDGYTGYVLLGTDAYINEGDPTAVISVEDMILKVIDYADHSIDASRLIDEEAWVTEGYPHGYEFFHFPHGSPVYGNKPGAAVIWGSKEFHDARCTCHEDHEDTAIRGGIEVPIEQIVLYNDGTPILFIQPHAIGSTMEVIDKVFVVCQDADGNCYETYITDVPFEYFANADAE